MARVLASLLVAGADELVIVDHLRPVVRPEPLLALVGGHNLNLDLLKKGKKKKLKVR